MYNKYILIKSYDEEILPQIKDFLYRLLGNDIRIDTVSNNLVIYTKSKDDLEEPLKALSYDSLNNMKIYISKVFKNEDLMIKNMNIISKHFYNFPLREDIYDEHKLMMELVINGVKENLADIIFENQDIAMIDIVKVFIESNMNTTKASKMLYMHRNTLINKVDKFVETTGYDIKSFTDAFIIYHLVKK